MNTTTTNTTNTTNTPTTNTTTNTSMTKEKIKIIGYVVIGLVIIALLIYWILYSIFNLSGRLSIARFVLNLLLIVVVAAFLYKTFHTQLPSGNEKKNSFFTLIINILLYIPCLVSGLFDYIGKIISGQDKAETSSWLMLIFAIGLILAYFLMPNIFNLISTQGGEQLVNRPVYINTMYNLGSYEDLNGGSNDFNYQYAISCWVFMDASPPNTSIRYNKYISLLNF